MQNGRIAGVHALGLNAVGEPCYVLQKLLSLAAQLGVNVVDEGVGQNLGALDDHLVRVVIAVIAGLGENRNGRLGNRAAILIGHHLAHEPSGGLSHRV